MLPTRHIQNNEGYFVSRRAINQWSRSGTVMIILIIMVMLMLIKNNEWYLRPLFYAARLYWAGDNLG